MTPGPQPAMRARSHNPDRSVSGRARAFIRAECSLSCDSRETGRISVCSTVHNEARRKLPPSSDCGDDRRCESIDFARSDPHLDERGEWVGEKIAPNLEA